MRRGLASSYESASAGYAAHRPTYPTQAVSWLVGDVACDVLDLGAGTGLLSAPVAALGHRVVAAEPSYSMLRVLRTRAQGVPAVRSRAEDLPFAPGSFDVVSVATAFHWFEPGLALPQIAATLRLGGLLALVWNTRVESGGWPRRLGELLRAVQPDGLHGDWGTDSVSAVAESPLFGPVERAEFAFVQRLDRDGLVGLVASRSYVIGLGPPTRRRLFDAVARLFDEETTRLGADARSRPTVELPYLAQCWRAVRAST